MAGSPRWCCWDSPRSRPSTRPATRSSARASSSRGSRPRRGARALPLAARPGGGGGAAARRAPARGLGARRVADARASGSAPSSGSRSTAFLRAPRLLALGGLLLAALRRLRGRRRSSSRLTLTRRQQRRPLLHVAGRPRHGRRPARVRPGSGHDPASPTRATAGRRRRTRTRRTSTTTCCRSPPSAACRALAFFLWWALAVLVAALRERRRRAGTIRAGSAAVAALGVLAAIFVAGLFEYNLGDSEVLMLVLLLMARPLRARTSARLRPERGAAAARARVLSALLQAMRERRVLVVGDVMLDEFLWGRVSRISPEAPVPVVEVTRQSFHLGGAGNVAAQRALARRDARCWSGVVGRDAAGERVREALDAAGVAAAPGRADAAGRRRSRRASSRTASRWCARTARSPGRRLDGRGRGDPRDAARGARRLRRPRRLRLPEGRRHAAAVARAAAAARDAGAGRCSWTPRSGTSASTAASRS